MEKSNQKENWSLLRIYLAQTFSPSFDGKEWFSSSMQTRFLLIGDQGRLHWFGYLGLLVGWWADTTDVY